MPEQVRLTTEKEITAFINDLLQKTPLNHPSQKGVPLWRIEPKVITPENQSAFGKAITEVGKNLRKMTDESHIIYNNGDHKAIQNMRQADYESVCNANEMYENYSR